MIPVFMNKLKKVVFNWSGGKDSALALQKLLKDGKHEIVSLLTTINSDTGTSSIHSIPLTILEQQAHSIGIPLHKILISKDLKNYEVSMKETVMYFKEQGVSCFAFGDIFLADIKAYREQKLNPMGIEVLEPLWNMTSEEVIRDFLASGIKTKLIVTQADKLSASYIGKNLDAELIASFPEDVDLCGENGEYHTLAYDGDIFRNAVEFQIIETTMISHDILLDSGETKRFDYWQAVIT